MKIYLLYPDSQSPTYVHSTDSGMDLYAYHSCLIPPNEWRLIGTGIAIAGRAGRHSENQENREDFCKTLAMTGFDLSRFST